MKFKSMILLVLTLPLLSGEGRRLDRWANFRYLLGTWSMEKPGEALTQQDFEFLFNGTFLKFKTKSVFEPSKKMPKGEIHEDMGVFSYDGFRDKVILRCFYSEGFIIQFVLDHCSKDGRDMLFVSESVENAPPDTRARIEFKKISDSEFTQTFLVAWPDQEFSCFFDNRFVKNE